MKEAELIALGLVEASGIIALGIMKAGMHIGLLSFAGLIISSFIKGSSK